MPVSPPFSTWVVASSLELPAEVFFFGGAVFVPLEGSTAVEGTFVPTPVSSPDAIIRGTLSARLQKMKPDGKKQLDETQKVVEYKVKWLTWC